MAKLSFGLQFERQYSGPLDIDLVFSTTSALNSYLTNGRRYAGQLVTCLEQPGKLFILNNDKSAWLEFEPEVAIALGDITNVTISNPATGQVLTYNGTAWVNSDPAVKSVNGFTGIITLDSDDIAEGSSNKYYPSADASKLAGIEAGAQVNTVDSVNGETGVVELDAADIPYDNSASELIAMAVQSAIDELDLKKANINALASNITVYATTAASDLPGYSKLVTSITDSDYNTTAVNIPTGTITTTNQLVGQLVSEPGIIVGNPGIITIFTVGNIRKVTGNSNTYAEFFYRVYKRDELGNEQILATSDTTGAINPAILNTYFEFNASALLNNGTFTETDRLVIKYFANNLAGAASAYEFQFGGNSPVRTLLPVPVSVIVADQDASTVLVDTSSFDGLLSSADDTVQKALETIDALDIEETDPVFTASAAAGITSQQITNWDDAYSWGDHSQEGYLTSASSLDASKITGTISSSNLPALALTDVHVVTSQAQMVALTAQEGDVAIRTDINKSFIHNGNTSGTIGDWNELLTPTDAVQSVNGQVGVVSLDYQDVGALSVMDSRITDWDEAYQWGNHLDAGYLTSVSGSDVTQYESLLSITESQITDLQPYLLSVSESDVTQHQAALSITESQISDLQSYATQSYVDTSISNLVASSPAALDTLNELASALGNDANFSTTITNALATKATIQYVDDEIAAIPAVDLTGYATESYVNNSISSLVDSSPAALDTLNELAAALGDDPNFATTITNALASKATTEDVNNAVAGLATEQYVNNAVAGLATEQYVDDAVAGLGGGAVESVNGKTGQVILTDADIELEEVTLSESKILNTSDAGKLHKYQASEPITITVPAYIDAEIQPGAELLFLQYADGSITFEAAEGVTIRCANEELILATPFATALLRNISQNEWLLVLPSGGSSEAGASSVSELTDVNLTNLNSDQILYYNGSQWVNRRLFQTEVDSQISGFNLLPYISTIQQYGESETEGEISAIYNPNDNDGFSWQAYQNYLSLEYNAEPFYFYIQTTENGGADYYDDIFFTQSPNINDFSLYLKPEIYEILTSNTIESFFINIRYTKVGAEGLGLLNQNELINQLGTNIPFGYNVDSLELGNAGPNHIIYREVIEGEAQWKSFGKQVNYSNVVLNSTEANLVKEDFQFDENYGVYTYTLLSENAGTGNAGYELTNVSQEGIEMFVITTEPGVSHTIAISSSSYNDLQTGAQISFTIVEYQQVEETTGTDFLDWEQAYLWGNHAEAGYLTAETLPPLAITSTHVVADTNERNALEVEEGDVAIVTSESKSYIYDSQGIWQELKSPSGGVSSVNGETGAVTLTASDLDAYETTEVDTLLAGKLNVSTFNNHTHTQSQISDLKNGSTITLGTISQMKQNNGIGIGSNVTLAGSGLLNGNFGIAIGYDSRIDGDSNIAIGEGSSVNGGINGTSESIVIGRNATTNTYQTIQLGTGANNIAQTLQVWNHQLLNKTTGLIPADRIPVLPSSKVEPTAISEVSASKTLELIDAGKLLKVTAEATITIPTDSTLNFPIGTEIVIAKYGTGDVTIAAGSGVTINGAGVDVLTVQYMAATIKKMAANEWLLVGPGEDTSSGGGSSEITTYKKVATTEIQLTNINTDYVILSQELSSGTYQVNASVHIWLSGSTNPVVTTTYIKDSTGTSYDISDLWLAGQSGQYYHTHKMSTIFTINDTKTINLVARRRTNTISASTDSSAIFTNMSFIKLA